MGDAVQHLTSAARPRRRTLAKLRAALEPTPPMGAHGERLALHLPVLSSALARLHALEGRGRAPAADEIHPAVLELPVPKEAHHLFANPLAAVDTACRNVAHRMCAEAGRTFTHFACRWGGFLTFAGVGILAGLAHLRATPSLFNPGGRVHPKIAYALLGLSVLCPVVPALGALVGEQVAHLLCRGLEAPARTA